jgi:3D (Asp-Asp-Asp) domain-containing protein/peptidoglycan hydrolase CwlO-like protein
VRAQPTSVEARLAAVFTGFVLVAAVPVALAAEGSGAQQAGLRAQASSLEARVGAATLELYALETQLGRTRRELGALQTQRSSLEREQASARAQLSAAKHAVLASQAQLADLARAMYQQPGQDPLAVLLGAASLDEALAGLDGLSRAAGQSNRIVEQARVARKRLGALDARLAARSAELVRLTARAEARAEAVAAQAAERQRFIAGLRQRVGVTVARIASIEQQARAAEVRTVAIAAPAPAPQLAPVEISAPLPPLAAGPRTLTVSSSGYTLRGRTATGIPTAPGVVAVDPSVIPLGTRLSIPGYGTGIAADTGGAIQGNTIDLWFPTTAQALQWGRRTVTITLLQ